MPRGTRGPKLGTDLAAESSPQPYYQATPCALYWARDAVMSDFGVRWLAGRAKWGWLLNRIPITSCVGQRCMTLTRSALHDLSADQTRMLLSLERSNGSLMEGQNASRMVFDFPLTMRRCWDVISRAGLLPEIQVLCQYAKAKAEARTFTAGGWLMCWQPTTNVSRNFSANFPGCLIQ